MRHYALVIVVEGEDAQEAFDHVERQLTRGVYASAPWRVEDADEYSAGDVEFYTDGNPADLRVVDAEEIV
jgi:hypothetical protein